MRGTIEVEGMLPIPVTPFKAEPGGFTSVAPPPTSIETLRHVADSISGDGAFMMQGILRKAADELENWEWLRAHHNDIDAPILVCYDADKYESLEAAIDAARVAAEENDD
jgi:hypothetical protein